MVKGGRAAYIPQRFGTTVRHWLCLKQAYGSTHG